MKTPSTTFCSDPSVQPATIVYSLKSNTYSVGVLMASSDHSPVLAVAPFSPPALPGAMATANKYAFAGDVSLTGALPALVVLMNNYFHLTDNVNVLVQANAAAAWAALPAGQELLVLRLREKTLRMSTLTWPCHCATALQLLSSRHMLTEILVGDGFLRMYLMWHLPI